MQSRFSAIVPAFTLVAVATSPASTEVAPGQLIIQFSPGEVTTRGRDRSTFTLGEVSFRSERLRRALADVGVVSVSTLGGVWRDIEPTTHFPDQDYVPLQPASFRDYFVVRFPTSQSVQHVVSSLAEEDGIRSVTRCYETESAYWPSDELLSCPSQCGRDYQWGMENTGDPVAGIPCDGSTDIGLRGAYAIQPQVTTKIAILDSGIDRSHPDLAGYIDHTLARNFACSPEDPSQWDDFTGHGTSVAGIVAAIHSSDYSVAGICGNAATGFDPIVPLRVLAHEDCGDVDPFQDLPSIVNALAYSSSHFPHITVTSCSFSMTEAPADSISVLADAFYNAYVTGLFTAASAGNTGGLPYPVEEPPYPGGFQNLVTGVTAIGCDGSRHNGLRSGVHVDLAAPGLATGPVAQVLTTVPGGYGLFGWTSAASPHVAGAAALLRSHNPSLTNEDVSQLLYRTALDLPIGNPGWDPYTGHGLVRIDHALEALDSGTLVHAATSRVDTDGLVLDNQPMLMRNLHLAAASVLAPSFEAYTPALVDIYAMETQVQLQHANPEFVWVRGRESIVAPLPTPAQMLQFDGHRIPYSGDVIWATDTDALLRGYTYAIYDPEPPHDLWGWYPIKLPFAGNPSIFSYSYVSLPASRPGAPPSEGTGTRLSAFLLDDGKVVIRFVPPSVSEYEIAIFDAGSRRVRTMVHQPHDTVEQEIVWDTRSESGRRLPSGLYFIRLEGRHETLSTRTIVVR